MSRIEKIVVFRYKWIGGFGFGNYTNSKPKRGMFSNIYYKFLSGTRYRKLNGSKSKKLDEMICTTTVLKSILQLEDGEKDYFVGDENGNPVGGASFGIFCGKAWYDPDPAHFSSGPCFFRPSLAGIK